MAASQISKQHNTCNSPAVVIVSAAIYYLITDNLMKSNMIQWRDIPLFPHNIYRLSIKPTARNTIINQVKKILRRKLPL